MLARNPAQTSSRDVSTTAVLRRDQRGGVAAIIAFATIPMIAAAGLATDGLLAMLARPELSSAVDVGALAVRGKGGDEFAEQPQHRRAGDQHPQFGPASPEARSDQQSVDKGQRV